MWGGYTDLHFWSPCDRGRYPTHITETFGFLRGHQCFNSTILICLLVVSASCDVTVFIELLKKDIIDMKLHYQDCMFIHLIKTSTEIKQYMMLPIGTNSQLNQLYWKHSASGTLWRFGESECSSLRTSPRMSQNGGALIALCVPVSISRKYASSYYILLLYWSHRTMDPQQLSLRQLMRKGRWQIFWKPPRRRRDMHHRERGTTTWGAGKNQSCQRGSLKWRQKINVTRSAPKRYIECTQEVGCNMLGRSEVDNTLGSWQRSPTCPSVSKFQWLCFYVILFWIILFVSATNAEFCLVCIFTENFPKHKH